MGSLTDNLFQRFIDWIWLHLVGPAIDNTFAFIPIWAWFIIAGVGVGFLWKKFGWQGVVGGIGAFFLYMAYRQGWKNASDLHRRAKAGETIEVTDEPQFKLPIPDLPKAEEKPRQAKPRPKLRYNADTNLWEEVPPRKKR